MRWGSVAALIVLSAAGLGCEFLSKHLPTEAHSAVPSDMEHPTTRGWNRDLAEKAKERAASETAPTAEATNEIAQERAQYGETLRREVTWLDQRVLEIQNEASRVSGAAKERKERDLSTTRALRARLRDELHQLDSVDDAGFPRLREAIDHDLNEGWPATVARFSEKSIAI